VEQAQRTVRPALAVSAIVVAALAVVGVLAALAAGSAHRPDSAHGTATVPGAPAGAPDPSTTPDPLATRAPATAATLPAGTGSGARIVYALGIRRVWVVNARGHVRRSYLVEAGQPHPAAGMYRVTSRQLRAPSPEAGPGTHIRYLIRIARGPGDLAGQGFCSIPLTARGRAAPRPRQGGIEGAGQQCIQQAFDDARYLWQATHPGTRVVIVP
jgi:hypothetical protein